MTSSESEEIRAPQTIGKYLGWLKKEHHVEIGEREKNHYDSVAHKVRQEFSLSHFWSELTGSLGKFDQEFQLKTGYPLLMPNYQPDLHVKPFDSFVLKTFRKNILENDMFPEEPQDGWILPTNWFSRIHDIVRTLLIAKYFDGVAFLIDKIDTLSKECSMPCQVVYEAREEGYYAVHLYVQQVFEIPKVTWDTERVAFSVEIQITTQLQEVIRRLLHTYYEERRRMPKKSFEKWQWDYRCDEFCVNYLGHILHYVEGMIMEIREKQKR